MINPLFEEEKKNENLVENHNYRDSIQYERGSYKNKLTPNDLNELLKKKKTFDEFKSINFFEFKESFKENSSIGIRSELLLRDVN